MNKINLFLIFIYLNIIFIEISNSTIQSNNNYNYGEPKSIQTIIDHYFDSFLVSPLGKKVNKKRYIIFEDPLEKEIPVEKSYGYNCKHDVIGHKLKKPNLKKRHIYKKVEDLYPPIINGNNQEISFSSASLNKDEEINNLIQSTTTTTILNELIPEQLTLQRPIQNRPITNKNDETPPQQQSQSSTQQKFKPFPGYEKIDNDLLREKIQNNKIRFYINDSYVMGKGDKGACHTVGQKIMMGFSGIVKEDCRIDVFSGAILNTPCYYSCQDKDILTEDLKVLLMDYVVKATFDIFTNIISVRTPDTILKLVEDPDEPKPFQCTRGVYIPDELYTIGINNTDHYVFITSRPTPDLMTIAYSLICDSPIRYYGSGKDEWVYERPRVSVLNFNPNYFTKILDTQSKWTFNQFMRVGIHEMVHSLGFSSPLYNSFINPDTGLPYIINKAITKTIQESGTSPLGKPFIREKYLISSPSVVNFTKDYFDCDSAEGFELEDYGGAGTAGSHWEKRTADEEIMTGYISPTLPLSRLTLSFLYDSGWYFPNFNYSEQHKWGSKLGCNWLKNCEIESWSHQGYYCDNFREMGCTANRLGKGICHIVRYQDTIPVIYQHFNSTSIGGSNRASDYCPYYQIVHSVSCPSCSYCSNTEESPNQSIKEEFGKNSRCFNYNLLYLSNERFINRRTNNKLIKPNNNEKEKEKENKISNSGGGGGDDDDGGDNQLYNENPENIIGDPLTNSLSRKSNVEKKVGCWVNRCSEKNIVQIKIDNEWLDCNYNSTLQIPLENNQFSTIVLELVCPTDMDLCMDYRY
ncbi:hypothetical protein ACTA71_008679 [Dictyostelium dimigraforme]